MALVMYPRQPSLCVWSDVVACVRGCVAHVPCCVQGLVADALAPACPNGEGPSTPCGEGRVSGLQMTLFLLILWLAWMVLFWGGGWLIKRYKMKKQSQVRERRSVVASLPPAPWPHSCKLLSRRSRTFHTASCLTVAHPRCSDYVVSPQSRVAECHIYMFDQRCAQSIQQIAQDSSLPPPPPPPHAHSHTHTHTHTSIHIHTARSGGHSTASSAPSRGGESSVASPWLERHLSLYFTS